jgi:hypothetical protein
MILNKIMDTPTHKIESSGVLKIPTKADHEREWRDSELERTDALVILPDYPADLTAYRQLLRDYPQTVDFPNGERPSYG